MITELRSKAAPAVVGGGGLNLKVESRKHHASQNLSLPSQPQGSFPSIQADDTVLTHAHTKRNTKRRGGACRRRTCSGGSGSQSHVSAERD